MIFDMQKNFRMLEIFHSKVKFECKRGKISTINDKVIEYKLDLKAFWETKFESN